MVTTKPHPPEATAAETGIELPSGAELMMMIAEMRADLDRLLKKDKVSVPRGYCNLKTASFETSYAVETIRLWCVAGAVRARRSGGAWLVRLADVKARQRFGNLDRAPNRFVK
jgi:hypothetical protein